MRLGAAILATFFATLDRAESASASSWHVPACAVVRGGGGGLTYTHDNGKTMASTGQHLYETTYTFSLVALGSPNTLLAVKDERLLLSRDAGCSWGVAAPLGSDWVKLSPAGNAKAFGWGLGRSYLCGIEVGGDSVRVERLPVPSTSVGIVGLGTDPARPAHIRAGLADGTVWESRDAGHNWVEIAVVPESNPYAYSAAFDPSDMDHILFGMASAGVSVTFEAGATWMPSTGLTAPGGHVNVFDIVASPLGNSVIWCQGLDMGSDGSKQDRHIYYSKDGGRTFRPVVTEKAGLTLANGTPMFAHPTLANVLYFSFGTGYHDYGTDLYRFNVRTGQLLRTHSSYHRIEAMAFSPADPSYLYLGVSHEIIQDYGGD